MSTHVITSNTTQLGQRFISCTCGHRVTGGVGDTIAEQNMAYHIRTARTAEIERLQRDEDEALTSGYARLRANLDATEPTTSS